jgi:hypothetical protein
MSVFIPPKKAPGGWGQLQEQRSQYVQPGRGAGQDTPAEKTGTPEKPAAKTQRNWAAQAGGAAAMLPLVQLGPERFQQVQRLRGIILDGFSKTEPHYGGTPEGSVFHTHYDYHSSVHAHWAALSMARVTGDKDLRDRVLPRLSAEALRAEREQLRGSFELPYGQAWMVVLGQELEKQPLDPAARAEATELKRECEDRLIQWLKDQPCPGEVPADGAHDSWLNAFALLKQGASSRPEVTEAMNVLQKRVEAARPRALEQATNEYDFLDLNAVLAFIDGTPPVADNPRSIWQGTVGELPERIEYGNAHTAGKAAMRLWPYAQDAAKGDAEAGNVVDARLREIMARPELYETNFDHVAHWVPQYLWMAMWQQTGRK